MTIIDEVPITPAARIYAEGWQSWSPTTWYSREMPAYRPAEGWQHLMRFRPGVKLRDEGLQGEGLVVIDPGNGAAARVYGAPDASSEVPTIRALWHHDRVVVRANSTVETWTMDGAAGAESAQAALESFGDRFGHAAAARTPGSIPRVWCTWYQYFEAVTASDVLENLRAIDELALPIDVVQIDDGWSLGTGEWTAPNPSFGSLADTVSAIRDSGRRAGIWLAPFSVGSRSDIAVRHPDWLTGPAGYNWG
ncbi:MAG: alpha-galactosidase, partial [Salinibacterium sp.]|nr:alpha-galactosidase [Salinibacterium sp.]